MASHVSFLQEILQTLGKRSRLVVVTSILSIIMFSLTFVPFSYAALTLPCIVLLTYTAVFIAILRGIEKGEWFTLFLLPVLFTLSLYMAYYLVPGRLLTKVPFMLILGLGFYGMVLASNIFNIAVQKNLQLMRAAFSVNFLAQVLVMFLITLVTMTVLQEPLIAIPLIVILSWLLAVQFLWSNKPKPTIDPQYWVNATFVACIVLQALLVGIFLPVPTTVMSLLIAATYYAICGLLYLQQEDRLYWDTVREYVFVWLFVVILACLSFIQ